MQPNSNDYVFRPAEELAVGEPPPPPPAPPEEGEEPQEEEAVVEEAPLPDPEEDPVNYAIVQAEAILKDAQREAEEYQEKARAAFEQELEEERKAAREEGYSQGFAQGMAEARQEAKIQRDQEAAQQIREVQMFLTEAAQARDELFDRSKGELKDLALAVAEKVIRISLRNSSDILQRMVDSATDTHKRCEWAHIYVADCDVRGKAQTIPELTAALRHISNRVRVIPMEDDESGTCIVELPDVILDASVSTQLGNIREVLNNTGPDKDG